MSLIGRGTRVGSGVYKLPNDSVGRVISVKMRSEVPKRHELLEVIDGEATGSVNLENPRIKEVFTIQLTERVSPITT